MQKRSSRKQYTDAERAEYYKRMAKLNLAAVPNPPARKYPKKKKIGKPVSEGGVISKVGGSLGSALGSAIGGVPGRHIGDFLGGKLGHLIETVTGFGDYHIENNTVLSGGMPVPQIVNSVNKGGVIVRHREYIGDIAATTAFTVQKFIVQPGLVSTFPWLAQIATSFEQYSLRGMLFEFVSTSSDALLSAATSTALGSVMMASDYDVADAAPSDKRQMLNREYSSSSKPSCNFIHPVECKKSLTPYDIFYTRNTLAVPVGFDARLYDFSNFYIATEGMQAASGSIGELWVTYEIEFYKQQYAYLGLTDHYRMNTITDARPLGTVVGSNIAAGGTIGGLISGSALTYSFPPQMGSGKFLVTYTIIGTVAAAVVPPTVTLTNAVGLSVLAGDTVSVYWAPQNALAGSLRMTMTLVLQLTNQIAGIDFAADGTLPTGTVIGDFWVTRIADSITSQ